MSGPPSTGAFVDAHVHVHPDFAWPKVLAAATRNFAKAGAEGLSAIMLTESVGVDRFADLSAGVDGWRISETDEAESVIAAPERGEGAVAVISGRQIVSAEGVEVLALGARDRFDDGQPLDAALAAAMSSGALVVLPWGVGKWSGRRGQLVRHALELDGTFLADSGVRVAGSARPALLAEAEARGRPVLAGTDPLPFAGDVDKPGRYGFVLSAALDPLRPKASIAEQVRALLESPPVFGRLEAPMRFFQRQVGMQIRKRLKKS